MILMITSYTKKDIVPAQTLEVAVDDEAPCITLFCDCQLGGDG